MNKHVTPAHLLRVVSLCLLVALFSGCPWDSEEPVTAKDERPALLELESFLTNISDPAGERYCKLTLRLAIVPAAERDKIAEDPLAMAQIRDQVLSLLTSKTFHELTDSKNKEEFREEIRTKVSELLAPAEVREVLFSDFVVQ